MLVQINIDGVGRKRRYNRNILQWSKNDFKSRINNDGDYCMKLISKIKFTKKFHRVCSTHLSSLKVWGRRDFRWWRHDRVWMGSWIGLFLRNCQGNNPKKARPFWWWLTFIYFNQPRNNLRDKLQTTIDPFFSSVQMVFILELLMHTTFI